MTTARPVSRSVVPVELTSEAAVPIGMAIHELTTNAVKHGALSTPGGSVEVVWQVLEEEEVSRLVFRGRNAAVRRCGFRPVRGASARVSCSACSPRSFRPTCKWTSTRRASASR